jgi:hypothetical protein
MVANPPRHWSSAHEQTHLEIVIQRALGEIGAADERDSLIGDDRFCMKSRAYPCRSTIGRPDVEVDD